MHTDDRLKNLLANNPFTKPSKPKKEKVTKENASAKIDISRLEDMSSSELVELAHNMGYEKVSRHLSHAELVDAVLGCQIAGQDPVIEIRQAISNYVKGNTAIMASGVSCDLDCASCKRLRVIDCYTMNHDLLDTQK